MTSCIMFILLKKKKYLRLVQNHIPIYVDGNEFFAM